jgi:hypothetical protein
MSSIATTVTVGQWFFVPGSPGVAPGVASVDRLQALGTGIILGSSTTYTFWSACQAYRKLMNSYSNIQLERDEFDHIGQRLSEITD